MISLPPPPHRRPLGWNALLPRRRDYLLWRAMLRQRRSPVFPLSPPLHDARPRPLTCAQSPHSLSILRAASSFPLLLALLFALAPSPRLHAEPIAFGNGESFTFQVGWGPFGKAGEIVISAATETSAGQPQIRITTTTVTKGIVRGLYPFDGRADCLFDGADGRLLTAAAATSAGKKKTHSLAVFDYAKASVRYDDHLRPHRSLDLPLPPGQPMDLITCLVQTRVWNLKPGDRRPVVVMFDDEFYDLTVVAERIERVKTPLGEGDALVLAAIMEKDPRGLFKRGGQVHVWISQDERRLPVKFEVAMKIGTGTARLVEHRPPSAASVALTP